MNKKYESRGTDIAWMKKLLFAGIFIQENRLHAVFDRYNDMSVKQWLLLAACEAFDNPPDLSSLAETMGCSRQNVKKIAVCLERDGYITLERSKDDSRSLIIERTEKGMKYTKERDEYRKVLHDVIFQDFTDSEIKEYYRMSVKMMHGVDRLEEFFEKSSDRK